jgi:acetyl-CoA C-acetyltransferase
MDDARVCEVERAVPAPPERALGLLRSLARLPEWLTLHGAWRGEAPGAAAPGLTFVQQIGLMGIPADVTWTVDDAGPDAVALTGEGPMGLQLALEFSVGPGIDAAAAVVRCRAGFGGDPVAGPIGASLTRAAEDALGESLERLAGLLAAGGDGAAGPAAAASVVHRATGTVLDPRTPVLVGAGQVVRRDGGGTPAGEDPPDPAALAAEALRRAGEDSGTGDALLRRADAVYAVASATWTYRDQAALVAAAVGATDAETVVSTRFGGDNAQRMINVAAQAIADGEAQVVLVAGAEAGHSLAAAQRRGRTPAWPEQDAGVAPDRVLGSDRPPGNGAETAVGLAAPVYVYALMESALAARAGETPEEHRATIAALWSRFSAVAAGNPYAWLPREHSAERLATADDGNRPISAPYPKLLCANLQVDLASGLVLTSVAAAEAAGVPQENWVFLHAGASGEDEWFVSHRADLAASPAIRTLGRAVLGHAGLTVDDLAHVDLYSCFPSAVQIAAAELGLPLDDAARPLTVTGGLTFAGGPGNNYGGHAVATLVPLLRDDPAAYGLASSLGWYVTKHALAVYSARPPARPYRHLQPVVEHPPSRPVATGYTGPAVVEAYTVPYDRDGAPEAAILSLLTPDGARVLVRTRQADVLELLTDTSPVGRRVTVTGADAVTLEGPERHPLPAPPPAPVLVERQGPVTVITLNRPARRNAVDLALARALERAVDAFEADDGAAVAVLTGAAGTFCSGMDLVAAARGEFPVTEGRGPLGLTARPPAKPLLAAVEGAALAGGFELALAADLVVAARDAVFGLPEPKRGLVAAAGGASRLATRLPRNLAMELALTGEPVDAERLAVAGLVNRLAEPGAALATAVDLARRIASNAPLSVRISKRIVASAADWTAEEAFDRQAALAAEALGSADAQEGVRAFAERREPVWQGR